MTATAHVLEFARRAKLRVTTVAKLKRWQSAGDDEGEHVADVDAPLCPACIAIVEDLMLAAMGFSAAEHIEP